MFHYKKVRLGKEQELAGKQGVVAELAGEMVGILGDEAE